MALCKGSGLIFEEKIQDTGQRTGERSRGRHSKKEKRGGKKDERREGKRGEEGRVEEGEKRGRGKLFNDIPGMQRLEYILNHY